MFDWGCPAIGLRFEGLYRIDDALVLVGEIAAVTIFIA
ncbi:hypothetical protein ABIB08_007900 [Bradyrhizobium sp. RT11b]